jgi:hypothetical protein
MFPHRRRAPAGWPTLFQVCAELGVSPFTVNGWCYAGCPGLGARRLHAVVVGCRRYFHPVDVRRLAAVPLLTDGRCHDAAGRGWLTVAVVIARLGCSLTQLTEWRGWCAWLGRSIELRRHLVREPRGDGWRWRRPLLFAEDDVQAIAVARAAGRGGAKDPWPSTAEVLAEDFSKRQLKTLRRGGRVRTRGGVRVRPNGFVAVVTEWCPEDLARVKEERRQAAADVGRGGDWMTDRQAAWPPFNKSPATMKHWRKHCVHLGRPLKAERRKVGRGRGTWYTWRADLEAAVAAAQAAAGGPGPLDDHVDRNGEVWLPTSLVVKRHKGLREQVLNGLRKRDERVRQCKGPGGRPRSAPSIRSKVISRRHPLIRGGKIRVWHQGDILDYVAYRQGRTTGDATSAPGLPRPAPAGSAPFPGAPTDCTGTTEGAGRAPPAGGTARRRRGPKGKTASKELQLFCYVEYRLRGRKRARVWADARARHGKPQSESHVTTYADRFAKANGLPRHPSEAERRALSERYKRGELVPNQTT